MALGQVISRPRRDCLRHKLLVRVGHQEDDRGQVARPAYVRETAEAALVSEPVVEQYALEAARCER